MYDSRVSLVKKLVTHADPLKTRLIISVSAVGVYASHGIHTEAKYIADDGFLGRLCLEWESEAFNRNKDIRTVVLRLGVVIGNGGALHKMLPFFRLGIGGSIAGGRQFFPWIHIEDVCSVIIRAITDESMSGIYNAVSPVIIDNKTFTKALARASGRFAWLNIPAFSLRLLYGKGSQLLTKGQHVVPERLCEAGYRFKYSDISTALESVM